MSNDTIMAFEDYKEDIVASENIKRTDSYEDYLLRNAHAYTGIKNLPIKNAGNFPQMYAFVDSGRWMWHCLACDAGIVVDINRSTGAASVSICPACLYQGWVEVVLPINRAEIEAELLQQPGFRGKTAFRNWQLNWDMQHLRYRTSRAREQMEAGVQNPRGASIGATRLWSVGEILTASNKNTFERQVFRDLAGRNGPIEYEDAIVLYNVTTTQRDAITAEDGMVVYNATTGRMEDYNGSNWNGVLRLWESTDTYTGGGDSVEEHTITHSLGVVPVGHQLYIENTSSSTTRSGLAPGERIDAGRIQLGQGVDGFHYSVYDKTTTQVKLGIRIDTDNNGNTNIRFVSGNGTYYSQNVMQSNAWVSDIEFSLALWG